MAQPSIAIDFEKALEDPTAVFSEPIEVVTCSHLTPDMRLAVLRQWEQTARRLSVAEGEGMGGGEENMLGRVEQAIAVVERQL